MQAVAADCGINRKTVESHFDLIEDLLLAVRLPPFHRRAKRKLTTHPKFYFFDAGVYRAMRPSGPLDSTEDIDGAAIETLVLQSLRAENANRALGYDLHFWRTLTARKSTSSYTANVACMPSRSSEPPVFARTTSPPCDCSVPTTRRRAACCFTAATSDTVSEISTSSPSVRD